MRKRDTEEEFDQPEREKKLNLKSTWREVARKQKPLMVAMIVLLVMALALLIFSLVTLKPQSTVVIVGYGDVYGEIAGLTGGYRRDSWMSMLAFPLLALLFGLVHNVIALRVYRQYGRNTALMVVGLTMLMVVGAFVVLLRLLGEW